MAAETRFIGAKIDKDVYVSFDDFCRSGGHKKQFIIERALRHLMDIPRSELAKILSAEQTKAGAGK